MSKTETWKNAARQQSEANLSRQLDRMDLLARSAEVMAESIARLSEESREVLNGLTSTNGSIQQQLSTAGSEHLNTLAAIQKNLKEFEGSLNKWKSQLEEAVNEAGQTMNRSARGILMRTWLLVIFTGMLCGGLTGWLTWRWSSQRQDDLQNAYRAGMKAVIEEMSQQYTITRKTSPPKPSVPRSGPSEGNSLKSE